MNLTAETGGIRIDRLLSEQTEVSRTRAQKLCDEGLVLVNGKPVKSSYKPEPGEEISATIPDDEPLAAEAENISLDILYEDADIIVITRNAGQCSAVSLQGSFRHQRSPEAWHCASD